MRSRTPYALLVPLVLLLAGCATTDREEAPVAREAGDPLPRCADVWRPGETLPPDYDGCAEGDGLVSPRFTRCRAGQRFGYARYGGLVARRGSEIEPVEVAAARLARECDRGR